MLNEEHKDTVLRQMLSFLQLQLKPEIVESIIDIPLFISAVCFSSECNAGDPCGFMPTSLCVCTWDSHTTEDVQGFLSHALNTEEVATRTCSLGRRWRVHGVNAYRNMQLRDIFFQHEKQSSIRGSRWNGEQKSTCVFECYTEGNQHQKVQSGKAIITLLEAECGILHASWRK